MHTTNMGATATGEFNAGLQMTSDMVSFNQQAQQISWLQTQYAHYKKKAKKFDKRNQKLELTNHDLQKQMADQSAKMNELTEK